MYTYAGYPLLLWAFARLFPHREATPVEPLPRVTLIISAYNESAVIAEKLDNTLALDYPRKQLEIIVVSDSSSDGTDGIAAGYAARGVRLIRQPDRLGKSCGLNLGVAKATGDIIVFSDANAIYCHDAIHQLVRHFSDPRVGYVVGNARYMDYPGQPPSAESEGLYWKLETWLKQKESEFDSVVGGDGAIYAIRRELFTPLLATDINDFLNPLQIIARGYRGVYESAAVCFEDAGDSFEKEFHRKSRIVSRSLNALRRAPAVLLPWTQPRHWFSLISHKVLRWFAPVFLLILLLATIALWNSPFYRLFLLLQVGFYVLAAIGWLIESRASAPKILYLPYYFCLVNLASLIGIAKCFQGALSPTWETIRQQQSAGKDSAVGIVRRES
ncbi:MAG: glycosyltransferase family 2 protein [Acidobacteriia bacterium]|nr:glycosyltransferase family 2 protein [Terriglobia bacterium]